jgi:hypothetical protein
METSKSGDRDRFIHLMSPALDAISAEALFDAINIIAVLPYEEAENSGTLALYRPGASMPRLTARFEAPFALRNARCARKYLHISNGELWLVSDCVSAVGFATPDDARDCTFTVRFHPEGMWELRERDALALTMAARIDGRPSRTLDEEQMRRALRATFPGISGDGAMRLCAVAAAAARQTAGTNLLISADARDEARRLSTQCTLIQPAFFGSDLIERFTSIDGTVIVDTNGACHAIGAILDGAVSPRGERGRGGRYNSAVMYLDTTLIPSVIVVVSNDGTVDILSTSPTPPRV